MADRVSIAIRQEQAINRLNEAAAQLAESVGVEAPTIRTRAQDRELLRADQLEALAAWAQRVAGAVMEQAGADTQLIDALEAQYRAMTNVQLTTLAAERGVEVPARATKDVLVTLLLQAADEQEA